MVRTIVVSLVCSFSYGPAQPIPVFSGLCKINISRPHGKLKADNQPMPIVKWPIIDAPLVLTYNTQPMLYCSAAVPSVG